MFYHPMDVSPSVRLFRGHATLLESLCCQAVRLVLFHVKKLQAKCHIDFRNQVQYHLLQVQLTTFPIFRFRY